MGLDQRLEVYICCRVFVPLDFLNSKTASTGSETQVMTSSTCPGQSRLHLYRTCMHRIRIYRRTSCSSHNRGEGSIKQRGAE